MTTKQQNLKAEIAAQTDRQIAENMLYFQSENEKHLRNISGIANWIFWIMIITIAIWLISMVMIGGAPKAM